MNKKMRSHLENRGQKQSQGRGVPLKGTPKPHPVGVIIYNRLTTLGFYSYTYSHGNPKPMNIYTLWI